jgi:cell division protease FtsH
MNFLRYWYEKIKKTVREHPLAFAAILGATGFLVWKIKTRPQLVETRLSSLILGLKNNMIKEVVVSDKIVYFQPVGAPKISYYANAAILSKDQLYKLLFSNPDLAVSAQENLKVDPLALFTVGLTTFFCWKMLQQVERPPVGEINKEKKSKLVKFDDIYGHEETKKDLREIIDYLKNPDKYKALGARIRRGVLLYGPSGTGKTMLAKAVANEAGINFLYQSATEFLEVYVGIGPKRVRSLFNIAREKAPCIIFIDELDAIGRRMTKTGLHDHYETNATINQLLVEMDGFEESDRIVVMAASNREKFIETALLRSGRFDLKIKVDLPSFDERAGILRKKLEAVKHNIAETDVLDFAGRADGFSGADIDTVVNECVLLRMRDNVEAAEPEHLVKALDKIKGNIVKDAE